MPASHTVIRLLGPTIESVCVALQKHGATVALAASFPKMLVAAGPLTEAAQVRVAGSRGGVEVRVDGSSAPLPLGVLSKELGCAALLARRQPAHSSGYTSLLVGGTPIWEEETGMAGTTWAYRLTCPALGIDLRERVGSVATASIAEAWRRIDAHVDALVGAATVQALSFSAASPTGI